MREPSDKKLKISVNELYTNLIKLKRLEIDNYYCANLLKWFNEVVSKNIAIYTSKQSKTSMDQELYKKARQKVFWIDFGRNIGSEFQDCHFAVVLYESKYTAIIIPLTSKKDQEPQWIQENIDTIVDLGEVEGFPNEEKECYACTFMLQTVSKKRLTRYGKNNGVHYDIKISDEQMKKICDKVSQITYNNIVKDTIDE